MIKGIIFDFNGTLFEDTHMHVDVWIQFFKDKLNYDMSKEEFYQRIFGRDNNAIIKDMFNTSDLNLIHQLSEEKEEVYRNLCRNTDIALVDGAIEFFDYLKMNGIPFTIATGSNTNNVNFYFEVFNLNKWFDRSNVVCDDGYLPGKPDPTIYHLACDKLNLKPIDCIVIEDSKAGVLAAKNAGMKDIYVLSHNGFSEKVSGIVNNYYELMEMLGV